MGATLSNQSESGGGPHGRRPGLGDIPEACVACVFMYLTPPQICNLARINTSFRGAASSDALWDSKLPLNYQHLLRFVYDDGDNGNDDDDERLSCLSKKHLFALLARSIFFDDGHKRVWLDRVTGKVCLSISARAMAITGIDDRRYWTWIPTEESRFQVVAYLQQIWWFEVEGSVKFPFPPDIYTLSFRLHLGKFSRRLGRRIINFEHTHGWAIKPVRFELTTSDGQQATSECCLDDTELHDTDGNLNHNHKRGGCWIEYKVGEFVVTDSESAPEIRFSMKQIDCTHSKGGLCVDSVSIIPSDLQEEHRKLVWK